MKAKNTVMTKAEALAMSSYQSPINQSGSDIVWWEEMQRFLEKQAEITWQAREPEIQEARRAGRKEEVEWLKLHLLEVDFDSQHPKQAFLDFRITQREWLVKLKDLGV